MFTTALFMKLKKKGGMGGQTDAHEQENGKVGFGPFIYHAWICNSVIKRNNPLTIGMNLKNILLRKELHTHKEHIVLFYLHDVL